MAVEESKYQIILQEPPFEIRHYEASLIAETFVQGPLGEAGNKGFRILADFIFGNNQSESRVGSEKIEMTAPVTMESSVIDRVEPMILGTEAASEAWRIQFTMPSHYALATLPKPKNPAVKIRALPAKTYAVVVFSGLAGEQKILEKSHLLDCWCQSKNVRIIGTAQLARYNPPWTLPPWRRNEILLEISSTSGP
jgi:hypothetical protein